MMWLSWSGNWPASNISETDPCMEAVKARRMAVRKLDRSIAGVGELFWRCGGVVQAGTLSPTIHANKQHTQHHRNPPITHDPAGFASPVVVSLDSSKSLTPFLHKSLRRPEHQVVPPGSQITEQLA